MADDTVEFAASEQTRFLDECVAKRTPLSVYMVNGIRLTGSLVGHDRHVLLLDSANGSQLIFKHAISTVMPATGGAPDRRAARG